MSYSLHPGAEEDLAQAIDFYVETAGSTVAARFINEFERVAQLLARESGLGTPTTRGRRSFPLKIFPYTVVYRSLTDGIRVMVVRHQHRRPGFGGSRR